MPSTGFCNLPSTALLMPPAPSAQTPDCRHCTAPGLVVVSGVHMVRKHLDFPFGLLQRDDQCLNPGERLGIRRGRIAVTQGPTCGLRGPNPTRLLQSLIN